MLHSAAYYCEQHISIAAGYVWRKNHCFSFGCLSDDTSHLSECTWTAIRSLLDELLSAPEDKKITEVNIISDSPLSQYRNKTTIFFLQHYATQRQITMRWLFLCTGHGKGIADGVGASIKRLFDNAVQLNPDKSFGGAEHLMNEIRTSTSIRLYTYQEKDIDAVKQIIPSLKPIKGTSKFHEIVAKSDGKVFTKNRSDEPETLIPVNF